MTRRDVDEEVGDEPERVDLRAGVDRLVHQEEEELLDEVGLDAVELRDERRRELQRTRHVDAGELVGVDQVRPTGKWVRMTSGRYGTIAPASVSTRSSVAVKKSWSQPMNSMFAMPRILAARRTSSRLNSA